MAPPPQPPYAAGQGAAHDDRGAHVRPYLVAHERRMAQQVRERRRQALRQRQLTLTVHGVDIEALVARGVQVVA